jgi:hypothetical protein
VTGAVAGFYVERDDPGVFHRVSDVDSVPGTLTVEDLGRD